ncbi:hypothetical protein Tco_0722768 [Tanacetum coccineum]
MIASDEALLLRSLSLIRFPIHEIDQGGLEMEMTNTQVIMDKEDTAYMCMHFTRNHEELKIYTPYPEDFIGHIKDYLKILEDIERDSDSDLLIPTPWSDESNNEKGQKDKDKVSQEHICAEEVPLKNNIGKQSGNLVEMPSEAVEQGMDDHVPDKIDDVMGEQVLNHVVKKGS